MILFIGMVICAGVLPEAGILERLDPRIFPAADSLVKTAARDTEQPVYALDYVDAATLLFCGTGKSVQIFDVLNPDQPVPISRSIALDDNVYDIECRANVLYIAAGKAGLELWDVKDPAQPRKMGSLKTRSAALAVSVTDTVAFVADADSGMRVISVANASEPRELAAYTFPGFALDIYTDGPSAYIADYDSGLRIVSIIDRTTPHETGRLAIPGHAVGVHAAGNLVYLADLEGFRIVTVKDPKKPREMEFYKTPAFTRDVFVKYPYAYLVGGWNGLLIINIADPLRLIEAGNFRTDRTAICVKVYGHYAYLAQDRGFKVVDVANPAGNSRYLLPLMVLLFMMVGFKFTFL